jgi:DNA-binding XRE family transcriptional regulator
MVLQRSADTQKSLENPKETGWGNRMTLQTEIETIKAGRRAGWRLGKLLREYRTEAGLTQAEMAKRLGISPAHLSDVELGRRALGIQKLAKLQSLLGKR